MQPQRDSYIDSTDIFAELYQRYAHTLLATIRRSVTTREDAEDVLLEVFLAALEHKTLKHLHEGEQLAWLRRVAHNKCVDAYRRSHSHPQLPLTETAEMISDGKNSPEEIALRFEANAQLYQYLEQLSEAQQEVLRLRFGQGLRSAEIANHLNKRQGAIRMVLARALNLLRDFYHQEKQREPV